MATCLMVELLLLTLSGAFATLFASRRRETETLKQGEIIATSNSYSPAWTGLAWTQLRNDGWCPSQLRTLFSQFNTSGLHYLHNLSRPNPQQIHQMIRIRQGPASTQDTSSNNSASLCTPFQCSFKQFQDDTYRTKHVDGCSGCPDVVAQPELLSEILENGRIPLVMSIDEWDENESITLIPAGPDMAYIAISHVWSDGLGNVQRNALPRCQLLRVSQMVRSLGGEHSDILLFWLDTICVPPDVAGLDKAQQLALQKMRRTYEDATAVLVLDGWLSLSTSGDKSDTENLMKIFSSAWNTRLWTYQEGSLASALYFQFEDTAYNLDKAVKRLDEFTDPILNLTLLSTIKERYLDLRDFRKPGVNLAQRLLAIMAALSIRTTSVTSDEALCLAALLDLDVLEIIRVEPNLRMQKFWRMLPSVPRSLLLFSDTLQVEGLRWAPSTFLNSPLNKDGSRGIVGNFSAIRPDANVEWATRTDRGLTFQSTGIIFPPGETPIGNNIHVRDENRRWFLLDCTYRGTSDTVPYTHSDAEGEPVFLSINPGQLYGCHEVAFVPDDLSDASEKQAFNSGALAAVQSLENGVIYCRKLGRASCKHLQETVFDEDIRLLNRVHPGQASSYGVSKCVDRRNGMLISTLGKTRPSGQWWCIG